MKSKLMGVNEDDLLVVVKILIQNGFTVKTYQTDDTLAETIVEFWKQDEGWQE